MNCRDINELLDTLSTDKRSPDEQREIDRHLADCHDCRQEWSDYGDIASLSIPSMPKDLGDRIADLLPSRTRARVRRQRLPLLIGGLLVAGAALSALFVLQLTAPAPEPASTPATAADEQIETIAPPGEHTGDAPDEESSAESVANNEPDESTIEFALDPFTIVVLARPGTEPAPDFASCYDSISRALRTIDGLNIVAGGAASIYDESGLSDEEIAGALGAGKIVTVGNQNGCNARLLDSQTGERLAGGTYGGRLPPDDGFRGFAQGRAMRFGDELLNDPATRIVRAQANIVNASLSDRERVSALRDLQSGLRPDPELFDSAIIAAVAQIGMYSSDARARESAWVGVRGLDDPALVQPLLQSLVNDDDETVRMQAALTLNTFNDDPAVRDYLRSAIASDPSQEPEVPCCLLSVRDAAERSLIPDAELTDWARARVLDESLSARERLLPIVVSPDGRFIRFSALGDEAADAIRGIVENADDPAIRRMAETALRMSTLP